MKKKDLSKYLNPLNPTEQSQQLQGWNDNDFLHELFFKKNIPPVAKMYVEYW